MCPGYPGSPMCSGYPSSPMCPGYHSSPMFPGYPSSSMCPELKTFEWDILNPDRIINLEIKNERRTISRD